MSRKSSPGSASRSPRWFRRFFPSLWAPSLASARHPSPSPSGQHLSPLSGEHQTASYPSGAYLSPPSAVYHHPLLNSQPLLVAQPSITLSQPEVSTYQSDLIHEQPLHLLQDQASTSDAPINNGPGSFYGAHHFTIQGGTFGNNISDDFMEKLLQHTIIGAEFDSSDRHPPPRCHPGTRLAIIERCKVFIVSCHGKEKMRWVVGPAGVGKSAVMQNVAEDTPADASVFLSAGSRQDGTKIFNTIAYQLSAKYEPYRQFISKEISRDPTLLRKALPAQFQKFIAEPFIHQHLFHPSHRFLVIIDGLDKCDNPFTQRELLGLISDFCLSYPSSPLVWFVASRPEPHITSPLDDIRVALTYAKEEIVIDSDEACEDVRRYLRDELNNIKSGYPTLKRKREWPSELEFTKIATAAGGLFAYASTVVRYIGDPLYGDPVSRLDDVLIAIEVGPKDDMLTRNNPLALLDTLYETIISKIPGDVMTNTRKLLLVHSNYEPWPRDNFRKQCNRLGLTEDAAYGAVRHLHAVVKVPAPDKADGERLTYMHKSFKDFLFDFKRSKFSPDIRGEVEQLKAQCSRRIVEQVPDNTDNIVGGEGVKCSDYGDLAGGPGVCNNVSLSWPGDERFQTVDEQLKLDLYRDSMSDMCGMFALQIEFSWNMSCFHALTTRFTTFNSLFPIEVVRNFLFDKSRREFRKLGRLRRVPLRTLDYAAICGCITFQFTSPAGMDVKYSDPWNPSCQHPKKDVDRPRLWSGWKTILARFPDGPGVEHTGIERFNVKAGEDYHWKRVRGISGYECLYCLQRLARHFINNPDHRATVYIDSTSMCYVQVSFVDPDDGVSKWKYRFFHSGLPSV